MEGMSLRRRGRAGRDLPVVAPQLRTLRRRAAASPWRPRPGAAELSPAHLSRLETGQRQPSLPMLLGLARVYGTTVSELLGETVADRDAIVRAADMEPTAGGRLDLLAGRRARTRHAGPARPCAARRAGRHRARPPRRGVAVRPRRGGCGCASGTPRTTSRPGDSAHFDSLTPHRIAADGRDGTDLLFVHTLLQSPTAGLCIGPTAGVTP